MYAVVVIIAVIYQVLGCDNPDIQPPIQDRVHFAKFVLQGKVLQHYPRGGPQGLDSYIAEIKVSCVFKASDPKVPGVLNVTNGGVHPGSCFQAELKKSQEYVVFLRKLDNGYEASAKEFDVKDAASFSNLTSSCGLTATDGLVTENSGHKCPNIISQPCPSTTPYVPTKRTKHPPHRRTHPASTPTTVKVEELTSTVSSAKSTHSPVTKIKPGFELVSTGSPKREPHSPVTKVTSGLATSTVQTDNGGTSFTPLSWVLLAVITLIL